LFKWKLDNFEIDFRVKSIYSIHKKIQKKWLTYAKELYDLFWIRIIVEDEADCYRVLWIIHSTWTPIPQRFKDYIALPKPNWYKSLHTNVMWLVTWTRKQPTEIQIKTYKMKEYSDIWVAAHFGYKEEWNNVSNEINWVKELKELTNNVWDTDFVWSLKVDVFKDRIFVFTPKWDFINLPAWSTSIDFAYYVHTELWNHITLAKVNGAVYPLDKELCNWDVVEIIVDKNKKPNPFWISFVKTVKAKNRIKSFLKKENKDPFIERWKEMMNKILEKTWLDQLDKDLTLFKNIDWVIYNKEERLNFLEQVGNFSINPSLLIKKILKTKIPLIWKSIWNKNINKEIILDSEKKDLEKTDIIIWWEKNLSYKLWYCCRRKLSNDIVAHINWRWIITIHKRNCSTLNEVNKKRLLSAYFEWKQDESLIFEIELIIKNITWVLKDLTDIIFTMWIDIDEIKTNKISKFESKINLRLKILDYDYLIIDRFIERLEFKFKSLLISSKIWKIIKDEEIK
jgi:GTP pyrophosphokinase